MKILVVDGRKEWEASVSTANSLYEDDYSFIIVGIVTDFNQLPQMIKAKNPDVLVVCSNMIEKIAVFNLQLPIYGYACMLNKNVSYFEANNIPHFGIIEDTEVFFNYIENKTFVFDPNQSKVSNRTQETPVKNASVATSIKSEIPKYENTLPTYDMSNTGSYSYTEQPSQPQTLPMYQEINNTTPPQPISTVISPSAPTQQPVQSQSNVSLRNNLMQEDSTKQRMQNNADSQIIRDLQQERFKTRVATIYSAKGGVGKTTIAAELASYLAMTPSNHAPGHYRVCIVDYNIDFGDVLTTLDYSQKDRTLIDWATAIDERINNGEDPEKINYSQKEIEVYLQKKEDTGLYALLAPLIHEDSLTIKGEPLSVMLRNIKENGNFDYVICDTGNNTRDSSFFALEAADYILMVATQDLSTVNDNDSFIRTISKVQEFDTSKIKLVINNILPTQKTGISPEAIIQSADLPCVAQIYHTADIIKANNNGSPLVLNPKHNYTKEIAKIAEIITGEKCELDTPKSFFARLFHK